MRVESIFRMAQIGHKLEKDSDVTIYQHDVIANFFEVAVFFLSSDWFWSHVNFRL